jgi:hypothetical protein
MEIAEQGDVWRDRALARSLRRVLDLRIATGVLRQDLRFARRRHRPPDLVLSECRGRPAWCGNRGARPDHAAGAGPDLSRFAQSFFKRAKFVSPRGAEGRACTQCPSLTSEKNGGCYFRCGLGLFPHV